MSPIGVWLKERFSKDRRRAKRKRPLSLVAHYWDGSGPMAHPVRNVSSAGFFLLTLQRWYPGTMITMVLQVNGASDGEIVRSIEIMAKVVRAGDDGVGFTFIPHRHSASNSSQKTDPKALSRFLQELKQSEEE
jgi:PilZ domain